MILFPPHGNFIPPNFLRNKIKTSIPKNKF